MDKLAVALHTALAGWETRIPTAKLNAWITDLVAETPPPVRGGKQPKVLFATQAGTRPPRFVLFTSGFLEAGYRRFIERKLREDFGFAGTPIEVGVRVREKGAKAEGAEARVRLLGFARLPGPPLASGLWRSLVAHLTGGQGVAGSNPVSPTDTLGTAR